MAIIAVVNIKSTCHVLFADSKNSKNIRCIKISLVTLSHGAFADSCSLPVDSIVAPFIAYSTLEYLVIIQSCPSS